MTQADFRGLASPDLARRHDRATFQSVSAASRSNFLLLSVTVFPGRFRFCQQGVRNGQSTGALKGEPAVQMSTLSVDAIEAEQAEAPEGAAAGKPNPDLAGSVRDFFLQVIAAEHKSTRALIQSVPRGKLDFRPTPAARSMSEMMWYLVQTEHHALAGICDGEFEALPETPEHKGANAVLAWDDGHFSADFRRLMEMSGDHLLRPVRFAGATLPAVQYLPLYLSLIQQFRGQLILYLALAPAGAESVPPARKDASVETAANELSEEDLAAVAGGGSSPPPFATITVTTTTASNVPTMSYSTDLGSLFNTGNSQVNQIEGYLVGAAFAVTGLAGTGVLAGAALATGVAVSSATDILATGGFALGGAVTSGADVAGQKA
jgi:hypothetical protein